MFKVLGFCCVLLVSGCFQKDEPPQSWLSHIKKAQQSYESILSAPSAQQSLYAIEGQQDLIYLVKNNDDEVLLSKDKSGEHLQTLKVDFATSTVLVLESQKTYEENTEISYNQNYKLKFYIYDLPSEKKYRFILYNLGQKNLEEKRKRSFFDYNANYKFSAEFEPLKDPKKVKFNRSDSTTADFLKLGKLSVKDLGVLSVFGEESSQETRAMLMFKDKTNGDKTYGAGRYLTVDFKKPVSKLQKGHKVDLDFNFATNPPCSKSKAFHCPLAQDILSQAIEAGEKF